MTLNIVAIEKETGKKFSKERIEEMVLTLVGYEFSLEIEEDLEAERTKVKNNPELLKVHTVLCTEYIEKLETVLFGFKEQIAPEYLRPLQHAIVEIKKRQETIPGL